MSQNYARAINPQQYNFQLPQGTNAVSAARKQDRQSASVCKPPASDWDQSKPDASFVSPSVASTAMRRFVSSGLLNEGFLSAETSALLRFEQEVTAFVEQLFTRAKQYSDIAARSHPASEDVLSACEEYDLDISELKKESRKRSRKRKNILRAPKLVVPSLRSTSPVLLNSDDEKETNPHALRSVHPHLPALPPKHTYLRTPAPMSKKQALPSLDKKLENAALVQQSLKNLLSLTEDGMDKNDGELFGGVVNWESTRQPRKRWKVGN